MSTHVESELRLSMLLVDSVASMPPVPTDMPLHHQLHLAHVMGFAGGLVASGVPADIVQRIASGEIARYGEGGNA